MSTNKPNCNKTSKSGSGVTEASHKNKKAKTISHDVSLQCTDGVAVTAHRETLAAHSDVLKAMLLGDFQEGSSDSVKVGLTGRQMQAIVDYTHPGQPEMFQHEKEHDGASIAEIADLVEAAEYYNIEALKEKCMECYTTILKENPKLSVPILEHCIRLSLSDELKGFALHKIFSFGGIDLQDSEAVAAVSVPVLEEMLKYEQSDVDEFSLYEMLTAWAHHSLESRKEDATKMVEYLHLERIDPEKLDTIVSTSGLVDPVLIFQAYKDQAFHAKDKGVKFNKSRHYAVWKTTGSIELDATHHNYLELDNFLHFLDIQPITGGKCTWTMELIQSDIISLGIMLPPSPSEWQDLEPTSRNWESDSWKRVLHYTWDAFENWEWADKVTFTLDLTGQQNNGTLSAFVDDDDEHDTILAENLLDHIGSDDKGFVPAAWHHSGESEYFHHIRLVDFRKIE